MFLFDAVRTRRVQPEEMISVDPELRTLRNLNTREDYLAALCRGRLPAALAVVFRYQRIEPLAAERGLGIVGQRRVEKPLRQRVFRGRPPGQQVELPLGGDDAPGGLAQFVGASRPSR